jgi:basic membrane protein A and related proteins
VLCLFAMIAYHACTRFTPLLLVMLVLLGGCLLLPRMGYATDAESSIPAVAVESNFRPAIIYEFSGKKGDKGFIDLVRKGAQRAKQEVGIDYQEFQIEAGQDRMEVFKDILRQGFTHIIAVGFQNMVPVLTVADKYPEVKFTVIDGIIPPIYNNVQSVSFKDHEGAFLVGVIAASVSKSEKLGFIGGMDVPLINNFALGFYQGARYVNKDAELMRDVVGTTAEAWNNPERAKALARKQYNDGVDVIFAAAGGSSIGVLEAAEEMGHFAIGVDTNQNNLFPGAVVTSMVKRVDKAVYETITSTYSGRWKPGIKYLGLREGALDYAVDVYNKDLLTLDIINKVEEAKDKIVRGSLQVEVYTPY